MPKYTRAQIAEVMRNTNAVAEERGLVPIIQELGADLNGLIYCSDQAGLRTAVVMSRPEEEAKRVLSEQSLREIALSKEEQVLMNAGAISFMWGVIVGLKLCHGGL